MKGWALALVVAVAATLAIGVLGLPAHDALDAPIHDHVGARYLEHGVEETGMRNLVGAVLLNYRGFDTLVEVVVIFTALAAVLALPRGGPIADEPEAISVSPIVFFVVRLLAPFIALLAIALLFRGHVSPGGGFQAGALFGALFVALGWVLGRRGAARLMPDRSRPWLQAAAPLTFAAVAAIGWAATGSFLGFPQAPELHAVREAMALALEVAIAVGGGVVLASLFQALEA